MIQLIPLLAAIAGGTLAVMGTHVYFKKAPLREDDPMKFKWKPIVLILVGIFIILLAWREFR